MKRRGQLRSEGQFQRESPKDNTAVGRPGTGGSVTRGQVVCNGVTSRQGPAQLTCSPWVLF